MTALKNYTDDNKAGRRLVGRIRDEHGMMVNALKHYDADAEKWRKIGMHRAGLEHLEATLKYAAARLEFLEMVVTGLRFMEQRDAADYAKFVEAKRMIEDMDLEEIRKMLR